MLHLQITFPWKDNTKYSVGNHNLKLYFIAGYEPNCFAVNYVVYITKQAKIVTLRSGRTLSTTRRMAEVNQPNEAAQPPVVPVLRAQQPAPGQVAQSILLSPWDGDINLSTKTGKSLWDEGIKPLENKFSGNGKDLARFLADVSNRANKCKWLAPHSDFPRKKPPHPFR